MARRLTARAARVVCLPNRPHNRCVLWQICRRLGLRIASQVRGRDDLVVHWHNTTFTGDNPRLDHLAQSHRVLNHRCRNISKQHVDRVFAEAFGYCSAVDPRTHIGPMVEKSNLNGRHDGRVVHGPIDEPRPDRFYQFLVGNETGDGFALDLRIPIFGSRVPFVFLKYKSIGNRFGLSVKADLADFEEVCTPDERRRIFAFCSAMGFDYGEIDAVRDADTGRLYLIDANTTPFSFYAGYTPAQVRWIRRQLADAFDAEFLRRTGGAAATATG
jgi:hypothetical protein